MPEISKDLISTIIKQHLGEIEFTLSPIDKGVASTVYEIDAGENKYIIRYNTASESRYELEMWVMESVRELGVPVSKSLYLGTTKVDETTSLNYVIQEKLNGIALSEDFPPSTDSILIQAGQYLKIIHSIKIPRFGHLTPKHEGVVRTWPEFIFHHFKSASSDYLEEVKFLPANEIDMISDIIISKLSSLNINDGRMLHVDLSLDHIFHDENGITGIIDFENVGSGDPLYDFATFEFYNETNYPDKDFSTSLFKGYGLELTKETRDLVDYYKLVIGFHKIANRIKSGKENTAPRVRELLKSYVSNLRN